MTLYAKLIEKARAAGVMHPSEVWRTPLMTEALAWMGAKCEPRGAWECVVSPENSDSGRARFSAFFDGITWRTGTVINSERVNHYYAAPNHWFYVEQHALHNWLINNEIICEGDEYTPARMPVPRYPKLSRLSFDDWKEIKETCNANGWRLGLCTVITAKLRNLGVLQSGEPFEELHIMVGAYPINVSKVATPKEQFLAMQVAENPPRYCKSYIKERMKLFEKIYNEANRHVVDFRAPRGGLKAPEKAQKKPQKYMVGFKNLETGDVSWASRLDGRPAQFTAREARAERALQNAEFATLQNKYDELAKHGVEPRKVKTRCVVRKLPENAEE